MILPSLSQISLYFLKTLYLLLKKKSTQFHVNLFYMHLFQEKICTRVQFFIIYATNEIFKFLFTKKKLIRHYDFIYLFRLLK